MTTGPSPSSSFWQKLALVALALLSLVLAALLFTSWLKDFAIFRTFHFAVEKLVDTSGLSPFLVKGILTIVLVPFFLALSAIGKLPLFKGIRAIPRPVAWGIVILYTSAYFFTMYFVSRGNYFRHLGGRVEATKFYAVTPEGIRFFDTAGVDPKYGIRLKPATPELIANMERAKRGAPAQTLPILNLDTMEFFDPLTAEPKVWYTRTPDGGFRLFPTAGFDPITGEAMKPITREVIAELHERQAAIEAKRAREQEQQRAAARAEEAQADARRAESRTREEKSRLEAQESAFRLRYVNPLPSKMPGATKVALLLLGDGDAARPAGEAISSLLKGRGVECTEGLFRPAFISDGRAAALAAGDWSLAARLLLAERVDAVFIVQARHSLADTGQQEKTLRTARLTLDLQCVDVVHLRPCGSRSIVAKGVGFSDADAVRASLGNAGPELQRCVQELTL